MAETTAVPRHVGVILDGNRRWAKANNMTILAGYRRGYDNLEQIASAAFKAGVEVLTIFVFSKENWNRNKAEVEGLIKMFKILVAQESNSLIKRGLRINFFGDLKDFGTELQEGLERVAEKTKKNQNGVVNVCVGYGGRDEIVRAVRKIASQGGSLTDVTEEMIGANLDSAEWPDPDLIIRTSGQQRLSGFLTWQSTYSELVFSKKNWPDFKSQDFLEALQEFKDRKRRFGK